MIKVNNTPVELGHFPDGTFHLKGNPALAETTVILSWHYENDAEFMALAFLTKYYQVRRNKVVLYMPYVPNARMDRIETPEDIFTLKYFGKLINSLDFEKVYVMDVHSNVATAVIDHCVMLDNPMFNAVVDEIVKAEGEIPLIFFPDEGAMKRYSKGMMIPYAYGMKKREWGTGNILGLEIMGVTEEQVKGKSVLIQDDICSKGGTFYYAAKKLKEMGASNIYLMVTHCENNIHNGEFGEDKVNLLDTGLIEKVYTTDSIYTAGSEKVIVASTGLTLGYTFANTTEPETEDTCDGEGCVCGVSCKHCDCPKDCEELVGKEGATHE